MFSISTQFTLGSLSARMLIGLSLLIWTAATAASDARLRASDTGAYVPEPGTGFSVYVEESTRRILRALDILYSDNVSPFAGAYTREQAAQMRAPFQIKPDSNNCDGNADRTGFLLVHGLTDSPYMLKPIAQALAERYPCALLRAVLLPGHGTLPGDSLRMTHEQWEDMVAYGVDSFRGEVERLYWIGYSTGSTLALDYLQKHPEEELIAGLIMLSPAVRAVSDTAMLAGWLRWVKKWLGVEEDTDAVKYESFSMNAGAEFYELTRSSGVAAPALRIPLFAAISADDATINVEAARHFFCSQTDVPHRTMLWYQSDSSPLKLQTPCPGIKVIKAEALPFRVVSFSHTSLTLPPDDPHYGLDASYRNCLHYEAGSPAREQCLSDDAATVYGERSLLEGGRFDGKLLRRATFNPHFDELIEAMVCFLENCQQP